MKRSQLLLIAAIGLIASYVRGDAAPDSRISTGRAADPTQKTLAEIRDADKRRIPLDVLLQASQEYRNKPAIVTIIVTNLFDAPLLMNSRMLVNHPRLEGELVFFITGPDGKPCEIQRLITPMSLRDDDFVVLQRGQSIQRSVDLTDLYGLTHKGSYKVRAVYHNDIDKPIGKLRAWKGAVPSDPVEFRIR